MKFLKIKKNETWGTSFHLILLNKIELVEYHSEPGCLIINYLGRRIDGYIKKDEFCWEHFIRHIEQNDSCKITLWENREEIPYSESGGQNGS